MLCQYKTFTEIERKTEEKDDDEECSLQVNYCDWSTALSFPLLKCDASYVKHHVKFCLH
jgi:hypothetical protein